MNIAIYSKVFKKDHLPYLPDLIQALHHLGYQITVYEPYLMSFEKLVPFLPSLSVFNTHLDLVNQVDILISIGGDGTLLDTVHFVRDSGIPVAGINVGRLGFLADINKYNIDELVQAIHSHNYIIEDRTLMHVETSRDVFGEVNYGLNELTLQKTDSSSMIIVHTYLNGEFLNSFWADGLIACTPTGSTAYSLSCGGPIITPSNETFVITPIAPHNLNVRPLIVNDGVEIHLKVKSRVPQYSLSLDSRLFHMETDVEIILRKAHFKILLIHPTNLSFYETIRQKLLWGNDKRN